MRSIKLIVTGEPTMRFRATAVEPVTLSWLLRHAAAEPVCRETVLEPGEHVIIVGREEPEEIQLSMPISSNGGGGGMKGRDEDPDH